MIRIVDSKYIDKLRFDSLLKAHYGNPFCLENYFSPLLEHWSLVVLDDYAGVLIVPFKKKMFWSWVYTPQFFRASYWLGTWSAEEQAQALDVIQSKFSFGSLNIGACTARNNELFHQQISPDKYDSNNYNTLCKRMLKKADGQAFRFTKEFQKEEFLRFLSEELGAKISDFKGDSIGYFRKLIDSLILSKCLHFEGAVEGGVLVGGILVVELPGQHLYLKGTASLEAKKMGVYYLLMHRAILRAVDQGSVFDFGGSRIEGVAQFNRNFGANDVFYGNITWGKTPFWFGFIKKILKKQ